MNIRETGSISFWASHEHADWATNGNGYNFGPFTVESISVRAKKHPSGSITFDVDGPLGQVFEIEAAMPACGPKGLYVAITWKHDTLNLYLNGELVKTVSGPPASEAS